MAIGYDQLKDVAKILREADKIEQYNMILDTQQQLLDMQEKIRKLEEEKRELKDKLRLKGSLQHKHEAYWSISSEGVEDGPYCTACWDSKEKLVRTKFYYENRDICPVCNQIFRVR